MTFLKLEDCKKCISLPSLGLLESLKSLTIRGMKVVKTIGSEFYGENCSKPFQSLETLCFEDLEAWESWFPIKENEGVENFPKLQELSIISCPKLSESLPDNLSLLEKLVIHNCAELVVSISTFPMLRQLDVDNCKKIVCSSPLSFKSLNSLNLSNILNFENLQMQDCQKVEVLKVEGCDELVNLWDNPPQGWHSLISLRELYFSKCNTLTTFVEEITQNNTHLEELDISDCDSLTFVFRGKLPPSLKKLRITNCKKLQYVLDDSSPLSTKHKERVNSNTSHLEVLDIELCPSLMCLPSVDQLSTTLTSLSISYCSNLTTLSLTGCLLVALKHLRIFHCSELTTLFPKGHLPETLETLEIWGCDKLESIVEKFHNNKALYQIEILFCDILKSLPEGLETLSGLHSITIKHCKGFAFFPKGGFPDSNLTVWLKGCKKLEALPSGIHTLSSLQITDCPNMSLTEEGLPPKLEWLSIVGNKQYKALMGRGLHNFTSLTWLKIYNHTAGDWIQLEEDMTLPHTLTDLEIGGFGKLKNLPFKDFENLSSLEELMISNCPKLTSLPNLPSSLRSLIIGGCPLLKEGKMRSKIADIPYVQIS